MTENIELLPSPLAPDEAPKMREADHSETIERLTKKIARAKELRGKTPMLLGRLRREAAAKTLRQLSEDLNLARAGSIDRIKAELALLDQAKYEVVCPKSGVCVTAPTEEEVIIAWNKGVDRHAECPADAEMVRKEHPGGMVILVDPKTRRRFLPFSVKDDSEDE